MNTSLRRTFVLALSCSLLAAVLGPSEAAQRRAPVKRAYDGLWSVLIVTRHGDCEPAYRYAVRIQAGRVISGGDNQDYQVYGAVGRGGAIRVIVVRGGLWAEGYGRLSRDYGHGWWRTSTGQCSGEWTAARRYSYQ